MLKIEKRPKLPTEENYFVLTVGGKEHSISVDAAKAMFSLWLTAALVFVAYFVGKADQAQTTLFTAYAAQGKLIGADNQSIYCYPALTEKKDIKWKCDNSTLADGG